MDTYGLQNFLTTASLAAPAPACARFLRFRGRQQYVIDADACLDCGTCAGECPVSAISEG